MTEGSHDGNDLFCEIAYGDAGTFLSLTYWDLWIVMILASHFEVDWDKLVEHFRHPKGGFFSSRETSEAYLSHAHYLRQELETAGQTTEQVLAQAGPELLRLEKARARRKVLQMKLQWQEKSYWVIHTPRQQREERAMRGYWHLFPTSPARYAALFEKQYKASGFYTEKQSFGLGSKLSRLLEKDKNRLPVPDVFALYRAFLTVILVKMNGVDDSFGVIGQLYGKVFNAYVDLDRSGLEMPAEIFFQDLFELLIWEDNGFTYQEQPRFFALLSGPDLPIVENILQTQRDELLDLELSYQAEKALTMLGLLFTQQQMFDRFIPWARLMGTREWQRITRMAEMAEGQGKPDLAVAVYEACLGPGFHEKFLREKYEQLKERLMG